MKTINEKWKTYADGFQAAQKEIVSDVLQLPDEDFLKISQQVFNFWGAWAKDIARRRGLKTDTFSALKHCATEIVEASEQVFEDSKECKKEIADIVICALSASASVEIEGYSIGDSLFDTVKKNLARILAEPVGGEKKESRAGI